MALVTASTRAYIGKGHVKLAPLTAQAVSGALVTLGNASKLTLSITEEEKELPDYTSAGGGAYAAVSRIQSVKGSVTVHDLSPANLALALRATRSGVASAAVVDEVHTAYTGGDLVLDYIPDPSTIVVKDEAATTTYVLDTDYTVNLSGITVLASGAINDEDVLKISYTKNGSVLLQALATAGLEWQLVFDGLNEADSGHPVIVTGHRVKFGAAAGLDLIGDDFAGLELGFTLIKNTLITGTGLSPYLKAEIVA